MCFATVCTVNRNCSLENHAAGPLGDRRAYFKRARPEFIAH